MSHRSWKAHGKNLHYISVFNLLYQPNAQYYVHVNSKDIALTCSGTIVPSSGRKIYQGYN